MAIRRLVIDVLIPHEPDETVYAEKIAALDNIDGVTLRVTEVDERTKTTEITIEGEAVSFESVKKAIEDIGGSVHSIDQVSAGSRIVEIQTSDNGSR